MNPVSTRTRHKSSFVFLISFAISFFSQLSSVASDLEHTCYPGSEDRPSGICGDALVDQINFVCELVEQAMANSNLVKRSYPNEINKAVQDFEANKKDYFSVNKKNAFSFLSKRQGQQNVICECCIHPCRPVEMIQYCDFPNFRRVRSVFPKTTISMKK